MAKAKSILFARSAGAFIARMLRTISLRNTSSPQILEAILHWSTRRALNVKK